MAFMNFLAILGLFAVAQEEFLIFRGTTPEGDKRVANVVLLLTNKIRNLCCGTLLLLFKDRFRRHVETRRRHIACQLKSKKTFNASFYAAYGDVVTKECRT